MDNKHKNKLKYMPIPSQAFQTFFYDEAADAATVKLEICLSAISELAILVGGEESVKAARGLNWGTQSILWKKGRTKATTTTIVLEQLGSILKQIGERGERSLPGKMHQFYRIRGEAYMNEYGLAGIQNPYGLGPYPMAYSDSDDLKPDTRHFLISDSADKTVGGVRFIVSPEGTDEKLRFEGKVTTVKKIFNYKTRKAVRNMRCAELGGLAVDSNKRGEGIATTALTEILEAMGSADGRTREVITKADIIFAELTPGSNGPVCHALADNGSRWHSIIVAGGMATGATSAPVMRTVVAFSLNKHLIDEMKSNKKHGKEWITLQEHMANPGLAATLSSATRISMLVKKAFNVVRLKSAFGETCQLDKQKALKAIRKAIPGLKVR